MSRIFIERPIFAAVLSILIILVGAIAQRALPVAEYPDIAPPTVNIAAAHGATAEVEVEPGFPVTVCDGRAVDLAERTATTLYGEQAWITMPNPMMGAEDFAYVLQKVPGAMAFLGGAPVEAADFRSCCALHSNRMVIEEAVMARGIAMHCAFAEAVLAGEMAT